jgi:hypothetical protein
VKNPPRIERIKFQLSVDGAPPIDITIDGSNAGRAPR